VTVAYLINQYPRASHSFIRREIAALESLGLTVHRFSIRQSSAEVVDEADQAEQPKTRAILGAGGLALLGAVLKTIVTRPADFFRGLKLALCVGHKGDRGLMIHLIYLAEACLLLGWLRECGATHLHAHFGTNSTTVAMLTRELGGPPYSFTAHGPEEFDRPMTLKLGDKIARAKFVVGISEFGRSQLFRWCGHEHWSKIHVVHCGVDGMFLARQTPPPPATPRLACVGRLVEQKGQILLVQAAGELAKRGDTFEIVLVGDGPMRGEIERLAQKLNLGEHIRITGMVSNAQVRDELEQARAMVLPSFAEGLPVVIMESLALRRPVISTYVAGIPELVESGVNGWLVPPGSVGALAEAMRASLAASPTTLAKMGEAGAARVALHHDVLREARKLQALFDNGFV
jgi:colanic acid/amylovoran biosynthesis glycosyltransferase